MQAARGTADARAAIHIVACLPSILYACSLPTSPLNLATDIATLTPQQTSTTLQLNVTFQLLQLLYTDMHTSL